MRTLLFSAALWAVAAPAFAGEFKRADVTPVAQTEAADVVALGSVGTVERRVEGRREVRVAVVAISEVIKGEYARGLVLRLRSGDSLSVPLEAGVEALFFLRCEEGALVPLRGQRSVLRLTSAGAAAAEVARATVARRRSTGRSPLRLKRALLSALARQRGAIATDAAQDLLDLTRVAEVGFTPSEEATLIAVLEDERDKLEDIGPLIALVGLLRDVGVEQALLSPLRDRGRFRYSGEVARALYGRDVSALVAEARQNQSPRVRRNAIQVLSELASADHAQALGAIVGEDDDPRARCEALLALGRTPGVAAVERLQAALVDLERTLLERKAAAVGLVRQRALVWLDQVDADLAPFVARLRRSPSLGALEVLQALR